MNLGFRCPKCSSDLMRIKLDGNTEEFFAVEIAAKSFSKKENTQMVPYECTQCGYTEWYPDEPSNTDAVNF